MEDALCLLPLDATLTPFTSLALLDPQLQAQAASQELLNHIKPQTNVH